MKEFKSFDAFSKQISKVTSQYKTKEVGALNIIGALVEKKSKSLIGHLQEGGGSLKSWDPLAESTIKDKERLGYVYNDEYNPLYRTGELKDSIKHVVNPSKRAVFVGSPSEIAEYQELGTHNIPARSFLALAMFKEKHQIEYLLGLFLLNWIADIKKPLKSK